MGNEQRVGEPYSIAERMIEFLASLEKLNVIVKHIDMETFTDRPRMPLTFNAFGVQVLLRYRAPYQIGEYIL